MVVRKSSRIAGIIDAMGITCTIAGSAALAVSAIVVPADDPGPWG